MVAFDNLIRLGLIESIKRSDGSVGYVAVEMPPEKADRILAAFLKESAKAEAKSTRMDRINRPAIPLRAKRFEKLAMVRGAQPRHEPPMNKIKMCKVIETVDLDSRKDVLCTWFVISRKRPLFGPSGSLGLGYAQVIDDYGSGETKECRAAVEELFTESEALTFVKFARTRLNASTTIEPSRVANS